MKLRCVRLGERGIKALTVELRARVRDIGRDVVGHQLLVRRTKSGKYPPFFDDNPFGIYQRILAGKLEFPRHLDFYVNSTSHTPIHQEVKGLAEDCRQCFQQQLLPNIDNHPKGLDNCPRVTPAIEVLARLGLARGALAWSRHLLLDGAVLDFKTPPGKDRGRGALFGLVPCH
ncbi:rho family-interacting cell polarization regulator 1-like protein [Lates japonicus]|uniref:Rho family-interacting cell polarization regulator 1-like protein n=1 Tax=Lates japonicus TaxID=270547 RepID=A0AAD3RHD6_LATJO|nr:rho family-interacting cell polarization regulator 1-like protein [Lates japonicus]